ncbi:hypothetical protein CUMW_196060 [Citrus unshiu]|nr:hypothetical protein CUMW_196060 [Citrus unshiu]
MHRTPGQAISKRVKVLSGECFVVGECGSGGASPLYEVKHLYQLRSMPKGGGLVLTLCQVLARESHHPVSPPSCKKLKNKFFFCWGGNWASAVRSLGGDIYTFQTQFVTPVVHIFGPIIRSRIAHLLGCFNLFVFSESWVWLRISKTDLCSSEELPGEAVYLPRPPVTQTNLVGFWAYRVFPAGMDNEDPAAAMSMNDSWFRDTPATPLLLPDKKDHAWSFKAPCSWLCPSLYLRRDTGPTALFLELSGVDDGCYRDWSLDLQVARKGEASMWMEKVKAIYCLIGFWKDIVLKNGGTCLTTEECLLNKNRNPHLTKGQIENELKAYLGVMKIIWLPRGLFGIGRILRRQTHRPSFESLFFVNGKIEGNPSAGEQPNGVHPHKEALGRIPGEQVDEGRNQPPPRAVYWKLMAEGPVLMKRAQTAVAECRAASEIR